MGTLIAAGIISLDGYIVDADGSFAWAEPDAEVHAFVNDLERDTELYCYGRRMYEIMRYWADPPEGDLADSPEMADYASIWQRARKIVYTSTLAEPTTGRTEFLRRFDPDQMRAQIAATDGTVSIGGPTLAAAAARAGLVDELLVFTVPHLAGGGTPFFAPGVSASLRRLDARAFAGGTTYARYAVGR